MQLTHTKPVCHGYRVSYIAIFLKDLKAMVMATTAQTLSCSLLSLDELLDETSWFSAWIA